MSANAPGRREVAHRLFAAEFDDASLSYSESDEERAPNYVVTPTGARVNRLFAVGVLTETETVNDDVIRGRIADPTGAFVTYAGQYQPDAQAYLESTTPPAFLALTGKARTFEPDDSDLVYTSVRPESVNDVDSDTRDRWVVTTAEATLHRVAVFAEALNSEARGDALAAELEARGVSESLAAGIPLAIDHYGTTTAYLEAVRRLAVDALEQVAGDRDEVRSLDVAPGDAGDATLGALPAIDLEDAPETLETPQTTETSDAQEPDPTDEGEPATADETEPAAESGDAAASTETLVDTGDETAAEPAEATPVGDASTPDAGESTTGAGESAASETESAASAAESTSADEESAEPAAETDAAASTETLVDAGSGAAEPAEAAGPTGSSETTETAAGTASDDSGLGDFEDDSGGLGDFEADDASDESAESSADAEAETDAEAEADAGMYDMGDDEREELEAEFGAEFSTGAEVDDPGEAGIDVPDADELEAELDDSAAEAETSAATDESAVDAESDAADAEESAAADSDDDTTESAADVDLEDAAVEAMGELDDGDGAARDDVVAAVVDEYGADPGAVEDAIDDALMSGKCYEPGDDQLKAI